MRMEFVVRRSAEEIHLLVPRNVVGKNRERHNVDKLQLFCAHPHKQKNVATLH